MATAVRSLKGQARTPGKLGCVAALAAILSACGSNAPEYARYCADRAAGGLVVDDENCNNDAADEPFGRFGWYYQSMPGRTSDWDDEGYGYNSTPDFIMISNGQPVYGGSYARPPGVTSGRTATVQSPYVFAGKPVAGSTGRVITRGGFGAASGGKGGGS